MANKELTYKEVWDTLSKIDCSEHVEQKMGLSFLSWAWAWGILMEHYPNAQVKFYEQKDTGIPYVEMPDGTAEIRCQVKIENLIREMWLPVMDYKNNAVSGCNARQVSDTKMRCLVKCLALFGLGHYIYAGEDTPSAEKDKDVKKAKPKKKEEESNDKDMGNVLLDALSIPVESATTLEMLKNNWSENLDAIKQLKQADEESYNKLIKLKDDKKKELENV